MKTVQSLVVAVVAVSCVWLAPAGAKGPKQEVEGTITLGNPICNAATARWAYLATGEGFDGNLSYEFDVDKKTWARKFKLDVTGSTEILATDIVIVFYPEYGAVGENPPLVAFDNDDTGGEVGVVPEGMTKAMVLICQYGYEGQPPTHAAINVSFKYVAQGKKIPLIAR